MAIDGRSLPRLIVIGGGPVGIEFALRAVHSKKWDVQLLEQGEPMNNVKKWGFVKLFSPFELNTTELGLETLDELKIQRPDKSVFPTGDMFIKEYLAHLWRYLEKNATLFTYTRVIGISRGSVLKGDMKSRSDQPFRLLVEGENKAESVMFADAVVDISGTLCQRNWLGQGGIPALGERQFFDEIIQGIPNVLEDTSKFVGKTSLVVGSGYSAVTTINFIHEAAKQYSEGGGSSPTKVIWVTRKGGELYDVLPDDPLPCRKALCEFGNALGGGAEDHAVEVERIGSAQINSIKKAASSSNRFIVSTSVSTQHEVDNVIANVGYRPDTSIYQELQVHQCYATEGPMKLAAVLLASSGVGGDCLSQTAPGPDTLLNPEPNFLILGVKSYGRGSAFLLKIGHEQIVMGLDLLKAD